MGSGPQASMSMARLEQREAGLALRTPGRQRQAAA